MSIIAIGDIHGHLDHLNALIDKIDAQEDDTVVFIGDYIDRGPNSKGVINRVMQFQKEHSDTICLMGNHEKMMLDGLVRSVKVGPRTYGYSAKEWYEIWMRNGGMNTLRSYPGTTGMYGAYFADIPEEHIEWMEGLRKYHIQNDFFFAHAGANPFYNLYGQALADDTNLLWGRDHINMHEFPEWEMPVVCGHTPQLDGPIVRDKMICIDTGCFRTGVLTAIRLPEREIIQVTQQDAQEFAQNHQ